MPDIDKRSFDDILKQSRLLASVYMPEWKPYNDHDLGEALLKIFSHMQEEVTKRLNRVPEKGFVSFLDTLGITLTPDRPSRSPVTFYISEGFSESIFVPADTQVATAETESHGAMIYETEKSFTAIKASIDRVYSVNPYKDEIYDHSMDLASGRLFEIFGGENIQKHVLYMCHSKLFKLKEPSTIVLKIILEAGSGIEDLRSWMWFQSDGKPFSSVEISEDIVDISKDSENKAGYLVKLVPSGAIVESQIQGISGIWVEARLGAIKEGSCLPLIKGIWIRSTPEGCSVNPDQGFYNHLPLDLSKEFYPFGRRPRLYDAVYISSSEAFSKEGSDITLTFRKENSGEDVIPSNDLEILWEYWNGLAWQAIKLIDNTVSDFKLQSLEGHINFKRPNEMKEGVVNGVKSYWIRARLVNGEYGSDNIVLKGTRPSRSYVITHDFHPPWASSIKISYHLNGDAPLENCFAYNNLDPRDVTGLSHGIGFRPFIPLQERSPSIYIGFKNPLKKGNLSIFFSLTDGEPFSGVSQVINWSHWASAPGIELMQNLGTGSKLTLASTEGLGIRAQLLLEEKISGESASEVASILEIKGKDARLDRVLDHSYTSKGRLLRRSRLDVLDNTDCLSSSGTIEILGPKDHQSVRRFGCDLYWLVGSLGNAGSKVFKGIYPNTVWVDQMESISDEVLGSSDGEKNCKYRFLKRPVISPEVWVREGTTITGVSSDIKEVKDSTGKVSDVWVKWSQVDDFFDSQSGDRHYVLDEASGDIFFGDGMSGMIPPIGIDNIKASYRSGGGSAGNVAAGEINILKTSIAGVDRVRNHLLAEGGSDAETMEAVFERGPYIIRTMGKAVTAEDFERLAMASSSYVARAMSLVDGSRLKIIIIPRGDEDRPMPSPRLLKVVKSYLLDRSVSSVSSQNLIVTAPSYKEVRVKVDVIPKSMGLAVPLERTILQKLRAYLHPLAGGGLPGTGWEFGRPVHISDIYGLLEGIDGVDHVENLLLNELPGDVEVEVDEVICSGDHTVVMSLGGRS